MLEKILTTLLTRLLTEKFLVAVFLLVAEFLAKKTTNTLDDQLVAELRKALNGGEGNTFKRLG